MGSYITDFHGSFVEFQYRKSVENLVGATRDVFNDVCVEVRGYSDVVSLGSLFA